MGELWRALFSPIGVLLFMAALFSFVLTSFETVFGLYALEKFGYGPERMGTILMVVAVVSAVGKGALTGPTTRRWGEAMAIKASLLASRLDSRCCCRPIPTSPSCSPPASSPELLHPSLAVI